MKKVLILCAILAFLSTCQQIYEIDTQGALPEDNLQKDNQMEPVPEPEPEPEPIPEPVYLPSSIQMLAAMSAGIYDAGGKIRQWQYNEETEPPMIIKLKEMETLNAYQICNQYEYAYLLDIKEYKNADGEPYTDVYIDALWEKYSVPESNTFPAQASAMLMITALTNGLRQDEISIVSEVLPTAANGNKNYTITYTAKDWNLVRSLETISAVCSKYPLWVKSLDVSINSDNNRFSVTCMLTYCGAQFTAKLGAEKEKIPAAFGYKEPAPPPNPIYLPPSMEILAKASADILSAGGRITQWRQSEDSDPFLIIQTQGIGVMAIHQIFNQYEYVYLQDIRESDDNGEHYVTIYMNALRSYYAAPPAKAFFSQSSIISIFSNLANDLRGEDISITSEMLPTAANNNTYYTITYTAKDRNLVRSLEIITDIGNANPLRIKNLDISISSGGDLFTVICTLSNCSSQFTVLLGDEKNYVPPAFGYKEPLPPPSPVYLPPSIEILAKVSTDILSAGGKITQWQHNEDTDPFMVIQIQGLAIQSAYGIFSKYTYTTLQNINESTSNGQQYVTVYLDALSPDYTAPQARAFSSQSSAISMFSKLTNDLRSQSISVVSEVLPAAANSNTYYTVTYTAKDKNLISSLEIIADTCNTNQLRIKKLDISISSNNDLFTVICTLSNCDTPFTIQLGNEKKNIPTVFGYKEPAAPVKREWTIIVYMAADNDLESAAIADLNELEALRNLDSAKISILALLDRNPGYDMTNGNWSDTRLFEVKSDPNVLASSIISTRLDCQELGLDKNTDTELNTADPLVLSGLINFAKRAYPADRYALFMWGHGTGWRGGADSEHSPLPLKAVAFDDTQGQYMSLPAFGRAVAGKGLSVIGFDTCYAALLEVAYQIRNDAELFIGSEGAIMSTGWDYTKLFEDFLKKSTLSVSALGSSIQKQFSDQYASVSNATISQITLSQVSNLYIKFNAFAAAVAAAIGTQASRDIVLNQILQNVESYYFTSFPSDLYIDVLDFRNKITATSVRNSITTDTTLRTNITDTGTELYNALLTAITSSWASNGTIRKIGVHVIPLLGLAVPATHHELEYIKGSMAIDKNAFVENSTGWTPNATPQSNSLLDKLFYWTY